MLSLAYSPDGQRLAAACVDSTAAIIGLQTGEILYALDGHILSVNAVTYSWDGQFVATASTDNTIKIRNANSGKLRMNLLGHLGAVRRLWFGKDGSRLASIGDDRAIRIWNLTDGKQVGNPIKIPSTIMAFDKHLRNFAYWSAQEEAVLVGDFSEVKQIAKLAGYVNRVRDLAFNADGSLLCTTDEDGDAVVWDLATNSVVSINHGMASTVGFPNTSDRLMSVCSDKRIRIWSLKSEADKKFIGHDAWVRRIAFPPKGNLMATGDGSGSIRLWNSHTGEFVRTLGFQITLKGPPDSKESKAALAAAEELAKTRTLRSKNFLQKPVGGRYSLDRRREVWTFDGHSDEIVAPEFSPDGRTLASAAYDLNVRLWDVASGQVTQLRHPLDTTSLAFSRDGKLLVTGCWDDAVRVWNVADGTEKHTLRGHDDNVDTVAFLSDGKHVASAGIDRLIRIWNIETEKVVRTLKGHKGPIHTIVVSLDGKLLASGSSDRTIRIWDIENGETRFVLRGHTERVTALEFHPTENRLVSASNHEGDPYARVWDLVIGREIVAFSAPYMRIHGLAFHPLGSQLALTDSKSVTFWETTSREKATLDRLRPVAEVEKQPADVVAAHPKVLGYRQMLTLPQIHSKERLQPSQPKNKFLVLVVSVPHQQLFPSQEQVERLHEKSKKDPENARLGPAHSYQVYDPKRFKLILTDDQTRPASCDWPNAFRI